MEPAKEGDATGRGSLAAAGQPVFALVRRLVLRPARAGAKGRCQAGALRRRFCGAGETDGHGNHRVHRITAGRKVPVGDQSGQNARGGSAGRRGESELSGVHVSVRPRSERTRSEVPEYVSVGKGSPKGAGEVARNDEQSSVLQTNPGPDWRAEPAPARLGELLLHWVPHECLL